MKSLHQRPRSRLVPLPEYSDVFCANVPFAQGALLDVLLKAVRERTQLAVQRNDFKLETLPPHLWMNFRIVDEQGRQLGTGRNLAALKSELGVQARSAFQALAGLNLGSAAIISAPPGERAAARPEPTSAPTAAPSARYTDWIFGELPELMELRKAGQTLVGFPALIDKGSAVEIEVFDELDVAAAKHRSGLRRLIALQLKEPLKYLERNIPDLPRMATQFMPLGSAEELREQIIAVALDRAFLADGMPTDAPEFRARLEAGRGRLTLIAQEVARAAAAILQEHANATRKLKDGKPPKEVTEDVAAQLQRLVGKRFLMSTSWAALAHLPRYLKAVVMRLDKLRVDPARDAERLAGLRPLEQRWLRRTQERRGVADARLDEFGWLLEELRVSLFAQELRTPQPVSLKRLEKAWAQIDG